MSRLTRKRHASSALAAAAALFSGAAAAALQAGEAAPPFEARAAQAGLQLDYSLRQALQQGPVVVYFYPAAFTGGCSLQAKAFADQHAQFSAAGASVVGVSPDPIDRLQAFSADAESCAGKVTVASDAGGRIARAFQVQLQAPEPGRQNRRGQEITHERAERTSFVVTREGRIAATVSGVAPALNVAQALQAVQALQAAAPAAAASAAAPLAPAGAVLPTGVIAGVVNAGTQIELVGEGFKGTEGPLGLPDGSLLFTENQGDRIVRITPDGRSATYLSGANSTNALALRSDGALLAVQTGQPRVGVLQPQVQTLAQDFEGRSFGRPNDLVVGRDGSVWFTDSGANAPAAASVPSGAHTATPAVYRISPQGALQRVAGGIGRPNGIQLSPDERVLYVADTWGEHVLAFDIVAGGGLGPARPFAALAGFRRGASGSSSGGSSGADGLAVDAEGRLYVASSAGVQVFSAAGQALGVIALPRAPQNLAFAGTDRKTLYVVGRGAVWRLPVLTAGVQGRAK